MTVVEVLSIGKLAAGQQEYYLRTVADGVEEYYLGSGEAPGRWLGQGAARLQLTGQVTRETLTAILDGRDPATSSELWTTSRARLPGWDLTFSAPKSVSLLYALAPEPIRRIFVQAHEIGVTAAFAYLEQDAGFVRRGHGGQTQEAGAGLVGAAFRHRESRSGDPQLHTHVLLANLVATRDGDWRAVWSRAFYRHARAAGSLYQAVLRDQLTRQLGVSWRPRGKGLFEIDGIPQSVLRAFSRRRIDIENSLEQTGGSSKTAAQIAALTSRPAKPAAEDAVTLHERWTLEAHKAGFSEADLLRVLGSRGVRLASEMRREKTSEIAQNLARAGQRTMAEVARSDMHRLHRELLGPSGLTAQTSVFRRRDVVRLLCDRLPAGAPAAIIHNLAEYILSAPETVPLLIRDPSAPDKRFDERNVFTTRELLALEEQVVRIAINGQAADRGLVGVPTLVQTLGNPAALSQEQRHMVGRLCRSGNLIDVVTGVPGAGKTRGLAAAQDAWRAAGFPVVGCSVKASAAAELQAGAGIRSWTVARLLLDLERADSLTGQGTALPRGAVLVVDEAGMLGTRELARLLAHVHSAQGKLVLVGDPKQLPSIDAAGLFPLLAEQLDAITLTSNRRQIDPADRAALDAFRNDEIDTALASYRTRGRLHTYPDAGAQRAAMVTAWWTDRQSGTESVMLAYRRADIRQLNQLARTRMRIAGLLAGPELTVAIGDQHEVCFRAGDQVLLRRNDYPLEVRNGDRGVISRVDPQAGTVTVQIARTNGTVTLPRRYLSAGGLDHGYAVTIHASQGLTVARSHVLGNEALFYEAGLVALSRHRDTCHLHVTDGIDAEERADRERTHSRQHAPDEQSTFGQRLSISRADEAAISYTR